MADAGGRRHHAEVVERVLAPLEEGVALEVAGEVALGVEGEGALVAEGVDLDRVVDHEVDVDQRVDRRRVAADLLHRVAHRGQVDHGRDAGEVLHQHAGGLEGDLGAGLRRRVPAGDRLDVGGADRDAVLESQHVLEQDLDRVGQAGDVEALRQRVEPEDLVLAPSNLEGGTGRERVEGHRFILGNPWSRTGRPGRLFSAYLRSARRRSPPPTSGRLSRRRRGPRCRGWRGRSERGSAGGRAPP